MTAGDQHRADNSQPFPFVTAAEIELTPKAFMIDGFVGVGEASAWYGAPDSGKSCAVLDAGCHVAAGLDWNGRPVRQGAVLYVAAERGAVVKRRVLAWCKEHQCDDLPLGIIAEAIDLRSSRSDADRIIATADKFAKDYGQAVTWIIIDTLNRALAGGDENASKDMGALIASLDRIQRATGAHVSAVHHVPLDRTDRMRGHGSILGAVDLTVRVTKDEGGVVVVEADKANDLIDRPRHAFAFKSVELVRDAETGQITTAPVLVPCGAPMSASKKPRLTKAAQIALRALAEAINDFGAVSSSNRIPATAKVITLDQWRDRAYRSGISAGGERAQQQAFKRGSEHLIATQRVGCWDDQVWITS